MKRTALYIALLLFAGCRSQETVINDIDLDITVERLDRELYAAGDSCRSPVAGRRSQVAQQIQALQEKYGSFFDLFNGQVLRIGDSRNPLYHELLLRFMQHDAVKSAYEKTEEVFSETAALEEELTGAFRHVKFYFPALPAPRVIAYVSGFNTAIMLTDEAIGIGLDRFLGSDYSLYPQLGYARYRQYNMRPERIAPECVRTWLLGAYPEPAGQERTLLAMMLYEGKMLYVLEKCFPGQPLECLTGFTPEQLQWCRNSEQQMWQYLTGRQLLYHTGFSTIQKFTGDAPFTPDFTQESPGKAIHFLGYRIVKRYAERTGCPPEALMRQQDALLLLKEARYNP
ncbi:MAG: hypothetical protein LBI89_03315 [Prevotellaceae bacterium]|jgi:hypothetical protein|nr:hypothetical protein [Prevotellaceae bacterium]